MLAVVMSMAVSGLGFAQTLDNVQVATGKVKNESVASHSVVAEVKVVNDASVKQNEEQCLGFTGVIVDAKGMGLETTFAPAIYDVNGRIVYGLTSLNKDLAMSKGMVQYASDVQMAISDSRAAYNPLVVKALSVRDGRNSANKVNVVVSIEDAEKILVENEKSGMLDKLAVVFVK